MRRLRHRFAIAIVWGMLPLALLSGLPQIGCVCAGGEVRLFCEHLQAAAMQPDQMPAKCCCCRSHGPSPSKADASAARVRRGCCKPVLSHSVLPPTAKTVVFEHLTPCVGVVIPVATPIGNPLRFAVTPDESPPSSLETALAFRVLQV